MLIKHLRNLRLPGLSRLSIGRQIPLLVGGILIASLLLSGIVATNEIGKISQDQTDKLGNTLASHTASSARDLLVSGDRLGLNVMLGELTRSGPVARATIFSIDNKRIAGTESPGYNPDKQYALFTAAIDYQNVIAGQLRLEVDADALGAPYQKALLMFLGLAALLTLTGTVLAWNYASHRQQLLSRALRQLKLLCYNHTDPAAAGKNERVQDEIEQIAAQLELLITRYPHLQEPQQPRLPEEASGEGHSKGRTNDLVLVVRFSNLAKLRQYVSHPLLLQLLELRLPLINDAAQLYGGSLKYSAEGNAYIRFMRGSEECDDIFQAICCARLIQGLLTTQYEGDPASLTLELGISTLQQAEPEDTHPALSDSATSQALMLASLGQGKLLLDGEYSDADQNRIKAELSATSFGDDIVEVGKLPEQFQLLIAQQTEQINQKHDLITEAGGLTGEAGE